MFVPQLFVGKRPGCGAVVEHAVNPSLPRPPLRQPLLTAFAQLNTRRLWSSSGEVHGAFHGLVRILTHRLAWFVFKKPARRSSLAFLTTNPSGTMGLRTPMDARQAFCSTRTSQLRGYPGLWTPSEYVGVLSQDPCACAHTTHHTLTPPAFSFGKIWLRLFVSLLVCSQSTPSF